MSKSKLGTGFLAAIIVFAMCGSFSLRAGEDVEKQQGEIKMMTQFVDMIGAYLDVQRKWKTALDDKDMTLVIAMEALVELHESKGDKLKAIPDLQKMLAKYKDNDTIRKAILFKMKDVYKDSGDPDKALDVLKKQIIGI